MAIMAATLANGGIDPLNNGKSTKFQSIIFVHIFRAGCVREGSPTYFEFNVQLWNV